jgi:folate-binding protein YgfZ
MNELSYLRVIQVRGRDAARFLHAQLSAAVDTLAVNQATFACLCQLQGRVIALLLVMRSNDGYELASAAPLAEKVRARLAPYILREDVQMHIAGDVQLSGLTPGEAAPAGVSVYEPIAGLRYALVAGQHDGTGAFRATELARGVSWLDAASSETWLPQMLGYEDIGALSYRKGCFPGQEIIARTRYLGRLKQRAVVLELPLDTQWPANAPLRLLGKEADVEAMLLDHAQGNDGQQVAVVVVRASEPFTVTGLRIDEQSVPASGRWPEVSSKRAPVDPV